MAWAVSGPPGSARGEEGCRAGRSSDIRRPGRRKVRTQLWPCRVGLSVVDSTVNGLLADAFGAVDGRGGLTRGRSELREVARAPSTCAAVPIVCWDSSR